MSGPTKDRFVERFIAAATIETAAQLRQLAKAQQIVLATALRTGEADLDTFRMAIVAKRIAAGARPPAESHSTGLQQPNT